MPDVVVDTRGLNCLLPVIKARRTFKTLPVGAVMEVLATDPLAEADFQDFCEVTGANLAGPNTFAGTGLDARCASHCP